MPTPNGHSGVRTFAHPEELRDQPPPVGQAPIIMAALTIGILLMAIQLWLLTVALDLFLAGNGGEVWRTAVVSGVIFLGGLGMLTILRRRPRVHGTTAG
ncbi:MAG: DUF6755 family protein [Chloroflexota bacterium]